MTRTERQPPSELMREAASLLHLLGGMGSRHLVLIGGMVPPLLVPNAEVAHLGSADIDFCISVAMTEGATRQYAASLQELIAPYFEPASPAGRRWRKRNDGLGDPRQLRARRNTLCVRRHRPRRRTWRNRRIDLTRPA